MAPIKLFVVCLCLCLAHVALGQNKLKLGILTGFPINHNTSLYDLAVDYLKLTGVTPPNLDVELVYTYVGTDSSLAAISAVDMAQVYNVTGVIGGFYSSASVNIQIILRYYKIPQVSDFSTSIALSNKNTYPYFLRTIPPDFIQARALFAIVKKFGWTNVVFVYTADDYGIGGRDAFLQESTSAGMTVFPIALSTGFSNYTKEVMSTIETKIHVIVMFTQSTEGVKFLRNANQSGIIGPDYVYLCAESLTYEIYQSKLTNPADYWLFNGMIGVVPRNGMGPVFDAALAYATQTRPASAVDEIIARGNWFSFDIVYLYILAVSKLMNDGVPFSSIRNALLLQTLMNTTFFGSTGSVSFDKNGDRMGYYDLINAANGTAFAAGVYSPDSKNVTLFTPVRFFDGTTTVPLDKVLECGCIHGKCVNMTCVCESGWSGQYCSEFAVHGGLSTTIIIAVVIPIAVVIIALSVVVYNVYQRKRRRLLKTLELNQRSKVKREELTLQSFIGRGAMGDVFRATMRGSEVAVKRIIAHNMNKQAVENYKLETAMMCTLRHPNLVLFMGSCRDKSTNEMYLVMELLTRGSLHNVLHNKNISLSFEMRIHIATQAAQGMDFLHQSTPPIIHRDMKSHNILLDEKWNAKISDFGLTKTKENVKKADTEELGTIFWTAPEILQGQQQTEKSDCYAFGIILWELFHREVPYGDRNPWAVALDVIAGIRPELDDNVPYEVIDLMKKCWDQDPSVRPTAAEIVRTLRGMSAAHISASMSDNSLGKTIVEPPLDVSYLVATDIVGAGKLWEELPNEMLAAIEIHNKTMRDLITKNVGYEVHYKDNGFFVVFAQPTNAVNFCLDAQMALLSAAWPSALNSHKVTRLEKATDGTLLRAGLRVKMVVSTGKPDHVTNVEDGRVHYFGPSVDKLKVYLASLNQGEVILTTEVTRKLDKTQAQLVVPTTAAPATLATPLPEDETVTQILPLSLKQRRASDPNAIDAIVDFDTETPGGPATAHPYAVVNIDDPPTKAENSNQSKFSIPQRSITKGASLGRGSSGESFACQWSDPASPYSGSQQVVMKVFVAQSFAETHLLKLYRNVSQMIKMNHNNLVKVHGACFEKGHVALVIEKVGRGSLRQLLNDSTVQLDSNRKLQFLRDIAAGLQYLSKQDPSISQHKDLKTSRILITDQWNAKISGFGLDVVRDALRTMTSIQASPWTAPEIWTEHGLDNYDSVDVYSFGIIMWEILTRQVAFEKVHPIKLCRQIIAGDRPQIPATCPEALARLMQSCWAGNPSERPSIDTVVQELNRIHTL